MGLERKPERMRDVLFGCSVFMAGNFVYQAIQSNPNMADAIERSFYQLSIVLYIWWLIRKDIKF